MGEGASGGVLPLTGDIVAASAALAGFILVYLSAIATGYASFDRTARAAVRGSFRSRAWFAFIGIFLSVLASGVAALAKWQGSTFIAGVSLLLFAVALFWAVVSAALIALEIE